MMSIKWEVIMETTNASMTRPFKFILDNGGTLKAKSVITRTFQNTAWLKEYIIFSELT